MAESKKAVTPEQTAVATPAVRSAAPSLFDLVSGDWPFEGWPFTRLLPELRTLREDVAQTLRVEEFTDGEDRVVRAEMPGIDPERDVQIHISDGRLHLHAERRQESKVEQDGGHRTEFHYGSFSRSVPLPVGATEQDVKASYKDGILEVRIPVSRKAAEAKKIPIERA